MGIVLGAGGIMVISEDVVRGCWTEIKIEFMLRMVVRYGDCFGVVRHMRAPQDAYQVDT